MQNTANVNVKQFGTQLSCHVYELSSECTKHFTGTHIYFGSFILLPQNNKSGKKTRMDERSQDSCREMFGDAVVILNDGNQIMMKKCLKCGFVVRNHVFSRVSHW